MSPFTRGKYQRPKTKEVSIEVIREKVFIEEHIKEVFQASELIDYMRSIVAFCLLSSAILEV